MKKSKLFLTGISGILLIFGLALTGCPTDSGNNGSSDTPTVSTVTVSPSTFDITKGGIQQFNVTVTGTNNPDQTVNWSVTGGGVGTSITLTGGLLTVATGETATTLTVTATSTVDPSKSGTATVTVHTIQGEVLAVNVSPATPGVAKGGTQQFNAPVTGPGSPAQGVDWSVTGGIAGTGITAGGLLTVAEGETAATLTVTATYTVDPSKSGTATVTVFTSQGEVPTVSAVNVSPLTASVVKGGTQQFTVTVTGTNSPAQTVNWSVTGGGAGTGITAGGLLIVAAGESTETLTVTATSKVDSNRSDTANVSVLSAVTTVTVSPSTASVEKGKTQQFTTTVTGPNSPDQGVTWSVTGGGTGTSITPTGGLLTVAAGETAATLTVRATSIVDTSKSGTAIVTVTSPAAPAGSITFTGINSQYNGQYASFRSSGSTKPTGGDYLFGGSSISSNGITTGVQISSGSVTIPVHLVNMSSSSPATINPYNGNDKNIRIYLNIKSSASFTFQDLGDSVYEKYTINSVNFTNGNASANVGGNTTQKTLTITGITSAQASQGQSDINVGIFQAGTTPEQAMSGTSSSKYVAGAEFEDITSFDQVGSSYTVTVSLWTTSPSGSGYTEWTGSGTYDVYLVLGSGGSASYYHKQNVPFTSASTSVAATSFSKLN